MKPKPHNYRAIALLYAIMFLRDHNYSADPFILLMFVDSWLGSCCDDDIDDEIAMHCGVNAARECACPVATHIATDGEWLGPEDLRD